MNQQQNETHEAKKEAEPVVDKEELFERMPIPQAVAKLAIPLIFTSLVTVVYSMVDTYYVGLLNDSVETAAVTLASTVLLAFNAVNNLFGVGTSSMMSRALGRKDYDTVSRSATFGFYCALASGILFSILCFCFRGPLLTLLGADETTRQATTAYMRWTVFLGAAPAILNVVLAYMIRSEGASLHASIGTMSGCILNIILDPFFILPWGLDMGAAGAGLATFVSNCVACLYFFILITKRRGRTFIILSPSNFRIVRPIIVGIFSVGIPASIQNLLNVTSQLLLNNFAAAFGASAVAAIGIAYKVYHIPMQIALGTSQGIMPLVSYNYASGNYSRMKKSILFTLKIMLPTLLVVSIIFYICSGQIVSLFMKSEEVVAYGGKFLKGFSIAIPFMCVDFLAVGVFQSMGSGRYAMIFAILRKVILEIPLLIILNQLFPLYGLAYAQPVAEIGMSVAASVMLIRIFRECRSE